VSGATGPELTKLTDLAKEMGRTTQFSASDAADALGFLGMAGFKTNEMMTALPGVLNLAAAGSIDLATAADIASNVLSGYGLKVEQLSHVNDVLAKTASSTNTDVAGLGETFKYAGPVAAAAGISFEECAAMAGQMGQAGIQASQAGTALRGGLSRLLKPTKMVSKALSKLGVTVDDGHGKLRPMVDIMGDLQKAGASTADMISIFGTEAGPAFMAVMSQGVPALSSLTDSLKNSDGSAKRMADTMNSGAQGAINSMKSAFEGLQILLAEKLLPGLTGVVKFLTGVISAIGSVDDATGNWVLGIGGTVAALGPLLVIGGKIGKVFGAPFVGAFNLARGTIRAFQGASSSAVANTIAGWVRAAVVATARAAMIAGRWVFMGTVAVARAAVMAGAWVIATGVSMVTFVARMIATAAVWAAQWVAMAAMATARAVVMAGAWLLATGASMATALASMAVTVATYVASWVVAAVGAMANAVVMAAAWFVALGPVGWVIALVVGLVVLIIANWDTVVQWTTQAWSAVSGFIIDVWNTIVTWVTDKVNAIVDWISNAWETLKAANAAAWQFFFDTIAGVWKWISDLWDGAVAFFFSIPGRIGQALGALGDIIGGAFKGALNTAIDFVNWGIDKINGLIGGINYVGGFVGLSIPTIPHIPRMHTGGVVPGAPGSEMLAILQAGETVIPANQRGQGGGAVQVSFTGNTSDALATVIMQMIRTGKIQLKAA
jgi:TP901 family phage tail tape measure protein